MGRQINITDSSTGATVSMNTMQIVGIVASGSGSKVTYTKEIEKGAGQYPITVDESPSAIVILSVGDLFTVTSVAAGSNINAAVTYDNLVGTFTVGEIVVINNITRGMVTANTGTILSLSNIQNGAISNNDTIRGLTSGATALVNVTVTYTYSSGTNTQYVNALRVRQVVANAEGALNIISYDASGVIDIPIYVTDSISTINTAVNGSDGDVTLAGNNDFTGSNSFSLPTSYANATGITAFATGGQASATALTKEQNNVTVCATAGDSVKLPAAVAGLRITVKNSGAAALDIFPATSDSIDALAVNLAVRIVPGSVATFYATSAIVWESSVDETLTIVAPTTNTGQSVYKATSNAGNYQVTYTNASQAAARTYITPDAGADASYAMTEGAQTLNGVQTYGAINIDKAATGMTALAGGAQAGTALASTFNNFTTVATTADSAQLPAGVLGKKIVVRNSAAKAMAVFGQTGASINGGSANASVSVGPGQEIAFEATAATTWVTKEGVSGAITQGTSITTGVTLNTKQGIITTFSASTAGLATCTFTVTNSTVTATSNISVWIVDYAGTIVSNGVPIIVGADNRTSGAFDIIYYNAHATNGLSGVLQIGYQVIN